LFTDFGLYGLPYCPYGFEIEFGSYGFELTLPKLLRWESELRNCGGPNGTTGATGAGNKFDGAAG
jgi:hypothetical protein